MRSKLNGGAGWRGQKTTPLLAFGVPGDVGDVDVSWRVIGDWKRLGPESRKVSAVKHLQRVGRNSPAKGVIFKPSSIAGL